MEILEFGTHPTTGQTIQKFILTNKNNIKVSLINYGATLIGLSCPDKYGGFDDILLGFDDLEGYLNNSYFGSTIGRFANRICKGQFTLEGSTYQLACNNGENHLHGGVVGFDKKVWSWKGHHEGIEFYLVSDDGDEGYPGKLHVACTYELMDSDELKITFKAYVSNQVATIVNLTNHAFINLAGQRNFGPILDHVLEINASKYLPHENFIPTGEIVDVDDRFDFTKPKEIGANINEVDGGYDHNFCLQEKQSFCARIYHEASGRELEIHTSQPGVQFYTGNFLETTGKIGNAYTKHTGLCLEPQFYPDNVNQPEFPSSILRPGEIYEHFIVWKIRTR